MTLENEAPAELSIEELSAQLAAAQEQNATLQTSVSKLEERRTQVLAEKNRLARVAKIVESAGINFEDPEAETLLASRLIGAQSKEPDPVVEPPADPRSGPVDPQLKSELSLLKTQLQRMEDRAQKAEEREQAAIAKQKGDRVRAMVVEALRKAGCLRPEHVYLLRQNDFHLSDDDATVLAGPDYDPKTLMEFTSNLRDDDDYSIYFGGSGNTGSGMQGKATTGPTGGQILENPFRTDSPNGTEAARVWRDDKDKAKRLMGEARAAGKLDPVLAKTFLSAT